MASSTGSDIVSPDFDQMAAKGEHKSVKTSAHAVDSADQLTGGELNRRTFGARARGGLSGQTAKQRTKHDAKKAKIEPLRGEGEEGEEEVEEGEEEGGYVVGNMFEGLAEDTESGNEGGSESGGSEEEDDDDEEKFWCEECQAFLGRSNEEDTEEDEDDGEDEEVSRLARKGGKKAGSVMIYKVLCKSYYNATGTIGDQPYA